MNGQRNVCVQISVCKTLKVVTSGKLQVKSMERLANVEKR